MSQDTRQRISNRETERVSQDADSTRLAETRAQTDRLFEVAARSFAAMSQGDSHEFLRRSQQTGGQ